MNTVSKIIHNKKLSLWGSIAILLVFYAFLYKLLIPRITAFGCFDDCNNFMGGYFLLHGKQLFTQIFFNHAPFMAYLSAFIQATTHPQNLFELILRHRQFLLLFGLCSEILLVFRFGSRVLPFVFLYELTKFYLFGDRFLAEGFIVYPLIYLVGIVFEQLQKKGVYTADFIAVPISVWFTIFMREPYAISALLLLAFFVLLLKEKAKKLLSLGIFVVFSTVTLLLHNIPEFIYNIWTVNTINIATENNETHVFGPNLYKSFAYPFSVLFQNSWSLFGKIEAIVAILFIATSAYFILKKQYRWIAFLWILLGFSNIRLVAPGTSFYGSFHLLVWYALIIFSFTLMFAKTWQWNKYFFTTIGIMLACTVLLALFSKESYTHDPINQQVELLTNYGTPMQVGNVVSALSTPKDTLFLDGFDDIIYFVAHRYSGYQYSWYTSLMPEFPKYTNARLQMFAANPPDFYYGSCPKEKDPHFMLPINAKEQYVELYNLKDPSCLWVKKTKLPQITPEQWQKAGEQLYYLQPQS